MQPTVLDALAANAAERPDDTAFVVVAGEHVHRLSWGDLEVATIAHSERLAGAGVGEGDVVLVCLRHGPSMYPVYLGAMLAGAIPSFVAFPTSKQDPAVYWEGQRELVDRVRPAVIVASPDDHASIGSILPAGSALLDDMAPASRRGVLELGTEITRSDPDRVALVQHSSGTTGSRKGVALTYRQIAAQVDALAGALALDERTRVASWLPLYHDMGLVTGFLAPIHVGGTVVSIDAFEWVEAPHRLLELMDIERCDVTWLPNFAFHHLVRTKRGDETYRLDHVRAFVNCSEPCRAETFAEFASAFVRHGVRPEQLQVSYAMAETVFAMTQTALGHTPRTVHVDRGSLANGQARVVQPGPDAVTHVSAGRPLPGIRIRVDGADAGSDSSAAVGGLLVRGAWVFDGYHANPDATEAAFDGDWFRTGDLGYVLDGEVFVLGRMDDVIVHHGVNVYAHDLEAAAASVAGVKPGRSAAVGVFDPASGSDRIELIVERDADAGVDDDDLVATLKRAISDRFLNVTIASVHLVPAGWLVKTTSGKVSRRENLAKLQRVLDTAGAASAQTFSPDRGIKPSGEFADLVVHTIAATFDVEAATISRETVAADVPGWDSLGHTVLMVRVGRAVGREVPESVAARARTVGELIDLIGSSA